MSKKGKKGRSELGRALMKELSRRKQGVKRNSKEPSMLHTTEINDGYDWGRLNLQSVTEESSFQEFLSTAELAGTEFSAEKLNIKIVNPNDVGLLSKEEKETMLELHEKNKDLIKIPRRPKWGSSTSAQELHTLEREKFLDWRRWLAMLQEAKELMLTPYEKNLEFWRQLWRVVERSDVVVQIVDARNPLLFRCEDLERYVKEVDPNKLNMILVNKADFLTDEQRTEWAKYFTDINVPVAFFSATLAAEKLKIEEEDENETSSVNEDENDGSDAKDGDSADECNLNCSSNSKHKSAKDDVSNDDTCVISNTEADEDEQIKAAERTIEDLSISEADSTHETKKIASSPKLLNRNELVQLFKTIYSGGKTQRDKVTTIGLVGYPNVGKSSTINALLMNKKVSVSATPGKTKHFQTLYVDEDLLLCDCPGLVMPNFVCTKADMILNGILPIDQMRDHVPAITLLATLIPRHVLEDVYGLMLPVPSDGNLDRPPTAEELLNAHAYNRGFLTQNGQPDNSRSARYVLKDFVNGKLLYCVAPPMLQQQNYHTFPPRRRIVSANKHIPSGLARLNEGYGITEEQFDRKFFQNVHVKGVHGTVPQHSLGARCVRSTTSLTESVDSQCDKPWKKINKHANKNKREKTRRIYAHLDQH
ncbi:hypothetical protein DMN91_005227 [Ooceraea biroi]|uniref:Large subunit GTPase 1 homolog n=1 Tax=Ooceraea biroi TaxID=2015173 RepID=A0A3L8DST5_OOCBI|nr:large subunit GTPase 1 homolog [Ooceraea biroi]RLU22949.1 hypothetical protein DMN91_005227 [Ooceraea biroi]